MTGKEYQELAIRTCSIPYDRPADRLSHAVYGLNSEAGEVAGIMQRMFCFPWRTRGLGSVAPHRVRKDATAPGRAHDTGTVYKCAVKNGL